MPVKDEKHLYLQILATALNCKYIEKFIIFNIGALFADVDHYHLL